MPASSANSTAGRHRRDCVRRQIVQRCRAQPRIAQAHAQPADRPRRDSDDDRASARGTHLRDRLGRERDDEQGEAEHAQVGARWTCAGQSTRRAARRRPRCCPRRHRGAALRPRRARPDRRRRSRPRHRARNATARRVRSASRSSMCAHRPHARPGRQREAGDEDADGPRPGARRRRARRSRARRARACRCACRCAGRPACHGTIATSRPMRMRATSTSAAGHAIAQRQPNDTAITALSGAPTSDGSTHISANRPSTRGRSASSNSAPMTVSTNPVEQAAGQAAQDRPDEDERHRRRGRRDDDAGEVDGGRDEQRAAGTHPREQP